MVVKEGSRSPCDPRTRGPKGLVGDVEPREAVGTLRAMSPEEVGGDGAPEPDDTPSGPPPNPLDRPWVHPTELSSFVTTPTLPPRETRPREWAIGLSSAVAAVIVTVLVLVAFGALGGRHRSPLPPPVVTTPSDVVDYAVAERVGAVVAPSVVTIRAGSESLRPVGSGVVLKSDRIVTTAHLLAGAAKVEVVTNTGDELTAKVVGADPQTDLALLAVTGGDLQLAQLGSSNPLPVGRTVVAVTATRGGHYRVGINVVADRDVMIDAGTGIDVAGLLETGITVAPDMAGGALVDTNGSVVGILTRPAGSGPEGLAIPVSVVRDVEDQLDSSGKVAHGWIGVLCTKDDADRAQGGAQVQVVMVDSPAAKAGLAAGDVVVRAGGEMISGRPDLVAAVRSLRPQDPLDLQYVRAGHTRSTSVTLGAGDPQLLSAWPAMG
jgi:S1-C subfamily serine protease